LPGENAVALLVGNEPEGLRPSVLEKADVVLEIPMRGQKESLNVAVAFGIAAYEITSD
jgi:tRNA G18 (ribose-2'-O)-methylase SpoU